MIELLYEYNKDTITKKNLEYIMKNFDKFVKIINNN